MTKLKNIEDKKTNGERMVLNMGPSHPAMHGIIRILLELEGEKVKKSDVEIGYLHRGFEKTCENVTYAQIMPYTDRLNYVSPFINNIGYALAVEKLLGIEVTERCKYVRVIMCELSRVCDHLTCVGASAMELGAFTVYFYLINAREFLYKLTDSVAGGRITPAYARIGGLARDLPQNFSSLALETLKKVEVNISDADKLLTRNRIFHDRLKGTGKISKEDAVSFAFTGPLLRAAGIPYDVRKASPYLVYERFNVEIPIGSESDNYDRYLVRMEEMRQSISIVRQAIKQLPNGPVNIDNPAVMLPQKNDVYSNIESVISHFKLISEGIKPPKGEVYSAVEGANGELGFYIVSDSSGRPLRLRVRPPCFYLTAGLSKMIQDQYVADIIATFGQINMIGGELER